MRQCPSRIPNATTLPGANPRGNVASLGMRRRPGAPAQSPHAISSISSAQVTTNLAVLARASS